MIRRSSPRSPPPKILQVSKTAQVVPDTKLLLAINDSKTCTFCTFLQISSVISFEKVFLPGDLRAHKPMKNPVITSQGIAFVIISCQKTRLSQGQTGPVHEANPPCLLVLKKVCVCVSVSVHLNHAILCGCGGVFDCSQKDHAMI